MVPSGERRYVHTGDGQLLHSATITFDFYVLCRDCASEVNVDVSPFQEPEMQWEAPLTKRGHELFVRDSMGLP